MPLNAILGGLKLSKKQAWLGIGLLSIFQAGLLYSGFNGQTLPIVVPIVTYLFGIITKTAVDKIVKKEDITFINTKK